MPKYQSQPAAKRIPRIGAAICFLLIISGQLCACDGPHTSSSVGRESAGNGQQVTPTIVSLTPAITQMLVDMGKADHIVGVSSSDRQLVEVARCGTYTDPVMAQILEIGPDLVLTESVMPDRSDVPTVLRSLSEQGVFELKVIPHSRSIADIERALTDPQSGLGPAIDDPEAAERARKLMAMRLDLVKASVEGLAKPRVLMLINPMTLGTIGTGVTHDELLRIAGGTNAAAAYDIGYVTLTRSQLEQDVRPDVILILEPDGQPLSPDDPRTGALEGLTIPAVMGNRIVVISHPHVMLPSTAMPAVAAEMAAAIHPERADAIRKAYDMAEDVMAKAEDNQPDAGGQP